MEERTPEAAKARNDAIVTAVRNRLREYRNAQWDWASEARKNMAFLSGSQLTEQQISELEKRGQTPTVINILFQTVNQAVAMLTANDPHFQATAREDSDTQVANMARMCLDWSWYVSRARAALKRAIKDNYTTDRGVLHAYIDANEDYGQGEVLIAYGVPTEYYPDPHSRDPHWRDASHILTHRVFTGAQIRDKYGVDPHTLGAPDLEFADDPELEEVGLNAQKIGPNMTDLINVTDDWDTYKWSTIEDYEMVRIPFMRITEIPTQAIRVLNLQEYDAYIQRTVFRITSAEGKRTWELDEDDVLEYQSLQAVYGNVFHWQMGPPKQGPNGQEPGDPVPVEGPEQGSPNDIPGSTIQLEEFRMSDLLQMKVIYAYRIKVKRCRCTVVIGQRMHRQYILECDDYPIKPIVSNHTGNPYSTSDVSQVQGIQSQVNKIHALTIAHAASSTNLKVFVPRGSVDKRKAQEQFGKAGVGIIEYDASLGQPVVAQPAPLPTQLFANLDRNYATIDRLFGIYPTGQGDPSGVPETYKGTILLDEYQMRRIKSKTDDIDESLTQLGKVVLQLQQSVYQHEKMIRLVQPNGTVREMVINQPYYDEFDSRLIRTHNDLTRYHYDVIVVSGSTLPSSRWALLEAYREMYREGLIDQQEVLMKAEVFDAPEILARFGHMAQMNQQLAQQEDMIKQLKGDLQTAQRETMHARMESEMSSFRAKLKGQEVESASANQLFQRRLNDILANEKSAQNQSAIQ